MSAEQPPRRRSTPRPVYDEPVVIRGDAAARHLWGDEGSGYVSDRVYLSSDQLHVLEFTLPPRGAFRHSEMNPTVFAGDVAYVVLDGSILLIDPEHGEVRRVDAGQIGFFRRDTWHHALNPGDGPARVLEYFSPPPSRGTASTYGKGKPPPAMSYVDRRWDGRWPQARAERAASARIHLIDEKDHVLSVRDPGGQELEGLAISTEFLDVWRGSVGPGHVGVVRTPKHEALLFATDGELHVELTDASADAWHRLEPGDALFLPPGVRHRLVELSGRRARYWLGQGHVPDGWQP